MEPVEPQGERAALRGRRVARGGAEDEARRRQGETLEAEREPITVRLLVREEQERPQEEQESRPGEPDRPVARVEQDGLDAAPLEALREPHAGRDADLAPEIQEPGPGRQDECAPRDGEEPAVQLPRLVPAPRRRPHGRPGAPPARGSRRPRRATGRPTAWSQRTATPRASMGSGSAQRGGADAMSPREAQDGSSGWRLRARFGPGPVRGPHPRVRLAIRREEGPGGETDGDDGPGHEQPRHPAESAPRRDGHPVIGEGRVATSDSRTVAVKARPKRPVTTSKSLRDGMARGGGGAPGVPGVTLVSGAIFARLWGGPANLDFHRDRRRE